VASGGPAVMSYTSGPSGDYYGLVVYNRNDASGSYRIHIWNYNTVAADVPALPKVLALAASPNPSRDVIGLELSLPRDGDVVLELFDVQGRLVRTLVRGRMAAGVHPLRWDGRRDNGMSVSEGVYLARLRSDGEERRIKLVRTE